jgi:hypothetical protein
MKDAKDAAPAPSPLDGRVGIFWVARGALLLHTAALPEAEPYGDFLNYPVAHNDLWRDMYAARYRVDFDYFPRGRIVYNKAKDVYLLYHDACVRRDAEALRRRFPDGKCAAALDEHYQCRRCNGSYVDLDARD